MSAQPHPTIAAAEALAQDQRGAEARALLVALLLEPGAPPPDAAPLLRRLCWEEAGDLPCPPALAPRVSAWRAGLETLLAGGAPAPGTLGDACFDPLVLALFALGEARTVALPGSAEDQAEMRAAGLAAEFPAIAGAPHADYAAALEALLPPLPWHGEAGLTPKLRQAATVVTLGRKPVLCPYTAGLGWTTDSLDAEAWVYRHRDGPVVVMHTPDPAACGLETLWYLPRKGLLLLAPQNFLPAQCRRLLAAVLEDTARHAGEVAEYLAAPERRVAVADAFCPHVGHYIWNALSGWPRLFRLLGNTALPGVISWRPWQVFGGVTELYPERMPPQGAARVASETELRRLAWRERSLVVTLGDNHVTAELAQRVQRWCRANAAPAALARAEATRRHCDPLLLVTLRLENRSWVEQEEGYIRIIRALADDFPRLGVVLDGMNAGYDGGWTHGLMSLEAERALAARILAGVGDAARMEDSIGCPIAESMVWCELVDAYLAPVGAGMAKYRWIANKPGVCFSNRSFLSPWSFDGHLYDNFRDDAVPGVYLLPEQVEDVEEARHGSSTRANFSMDWRLAYAAIRDLLRDQLSRRAAP